MGAFIDTFDQLFINTYSLFNALRVHKGVNSLRPSDSYMRR